MSLLKNETPAVLYPWYHGYSPFLLGAKPPQGAPRSIGARSPTSDSQESVRASPPHIPPIPLWGVVAFVVLVVVVLGVAIV